MTETKESQALRAGQIWLYKTRTGEANSRLTILKTETHPKLGSIIHISVKGLEMNNRRVAGGVSSAIGHIPCQEMALRESLVSMVGQADTAPDLAGYDIWKEAFNQGRAGIWTIPVSDVIAAIEQVSSQ
ncbi:MAG: hypothetical protein K1Y36_26135 [Blastocatellia bacterium]|nr:hypothetical protein [Blastocatellia bacterium]